MSPFIHKGLNYSQFKDKSKSHALIQRISDIASTKASVAIWFLRGGYTICNGFDTAAHSVDIKLGRIEDANAQMKSSKESGQVGGYDDAWRSRETETEDLMTHFDEMESFYSRMPATAKATKKIDGLGRRLYTAYGTRTPRDDHFVQLRKDEREEVLAQHCAAAESSEEELVDQHLDEHVRREYTTGASRLSFEVGYYAQNPRGFV